MVDAESKPFNARIVLREAIREIDNKTARSSNSPDVVVGTPKGGEGQDVWLFMPDDPESVALAEKRFLQDLADNPELTLELADESRDSQLIPGK